MLDFNSLLSMAVSHLKNFGFVKRGGTFYLFKNGNWGLINFQKSRGNTSDLVSFTINIGVSSEAIRKSDDRINTKLKPTVWDCHWRERIGLLLPQKRDHWWKIDADTSLENLADEIISALNIAISELEKYISNESLEKLWLNDMEEGILDYMGYVNLTTLLKINNPESFNSVVEEILINTKGKKYEESLKEHIEELILSAK